MRRSTVLAITVLCACSPSAGNSSSGVAAYDASSDKPDASSASNDDAAPNSDGGAQGDASNLEEDASADAGAADGSTSDLCPDGFPRGTLGSVYQVAPLSPAPEGVASCANGDVFVSLPDAAEIVRVPLDGTAPEVWTTLTGHQPLGMACADNVLWVVDFGTTNATVFTVASKGDPGTPMPNLDGGGAYGAMNGVIVIKGDGAYATDQSTSATAGRIVRFQQIDGAYQASVVKSGLAYPNDLVFDPNTQSLDVTLTLGSQVLDFPVATDGSLGSSTVVFSSTPLIDAFDGVGRDENDALYVVHYLEGYVGRTSDKATIASINQPKSLSFRGGTLFITGNDGLYAAPLGICGYK